VWLLWLLAVGLAVGWSCDPSRDATPQHKHTDQRSLNQLSSDHDLEFLEKKYAKRKRSGHRAGIYGPTRWGWPGYADADASSPTRDETLQRLFASTQHPAASYCSSGSGPGEHLLLLWRRAQTRGRRGRAYYRPQQSQQQQQQCSLQCSLSAHTASSSVPDSERGLDKRSEQCLEQRPGQPSIPSTIFAQKPISRCSWPRNVPLFANPSIILLLANAFTLSRIAHDHYRPAY
jgi:hypothetical protein